MNILINTLSLFDRSHITEFHRSLYVHWIKKYPQHHFIFLTEENEVLSIAGAGNCKQIQLKAPFRTSFFKEIWLRRKLRTMARREQAALFISHEISIPNAGIPQLLLSPSRVPDLSKSKIALVFKDVQSVVVHTLAEKEWLQKEYPAAAAKIKYVKEAPSEAFFTATDENIELTKEKYTAGNEFFLYNGALGEQQNLMHLLKAFSLFKKRQRSSMQLVMAGYPTVDFAAFEQSLKTYRFKNEVLLLCPADEQEKQSVVAAAYACVFPNDMAHDTSALYQALQLKCAVIAAAGGRFAELAGDAALSANMQDVRDLAEKMMLLFQDERLRHHLVENGSHQIKSFDFETSAQAIWDLIVALQTHHISDGTPH